MNLAAILRFGLLRRPHLRAALLLFPLAFAAHIASPAPQGPGHDCAGLASWHADTPFWRVTASAPGAEARAEAEDDGARVFDASLTSPAFTVAAHGLDLRLQQHARMSWANTLGVLEISVEAGTWTDFVAAGGRFREGGYNQSAYAGNPLGTRRGWGGEQAAFTTIAEFPHNTHGRSVRLRLRIGSAGTGDRQPGWQVGGLHCESPNASVARVGAAD